MTECDICEGLGRYSHHRSDGIGAVLNHLSRVRRIRQSLRDRG